MTRIFFVGFTGFKLKWCELENHGLKHSSFVNANQEKNIPLNEKKRFVMPLF